MPQGLLSCGRRAAMLAVSASMFGCGGGSSVVTAPATLPVISKDINHEYSYAPASRNVSASSVFATLGNVQNPDKILAGTATRLNGRNASVTLDFGKEVAGTVTLSFAAASDNNQQLGIAFSESSLYIGPSSDRSSGSDLPDGALYASVTGQGSLSTPVDKLRGGFRYLTLFLNSDGWVDMNGVTLSFLAAPAMSDLQAHAGYFHSNDELLNRIWYAGAYTVQLNTIDTKQGRVWPPPPAGWENAVLGSGTGVLVDGAKRDRALWPADLAMGQLRASAWAARAVFTFRSRAVQEFSRKFGSAARQWLSAQERSSTSRPPTSRDYCTLPVCVFFPSVFSNQWWA
jgi:hypothetical protein